MVFERIERRCLLVDCKGLLLYVAPLLGFRSGATSGLSGPLVNMDYLSVISGYVIGYEMSIDLEQSQLHLLSIPIKAGMSLMSWPNYILLRPAAQRSLHL